MQGVILYRQVSEGVIEPVGVESPVPSLCRNVANLVRDACEAWPNEDVWDAPVLGAGDFIVQRGNTSGAGWIEISKCPSCADSETLLTLKQRLGMPVKLNTQVSLTHRNAGEHTASVEFVSDDASYGGTPVQTPEPIEILNASQATSTITINFAAAPNTPLRVGQVVSIYGFTDTRLNVNSATVASVVSPTQITVVGNDYTLTSTTIASTPGGGTAFIERFDQLGRARNGIAIVHGNGTVTNKRMYARSQGGLARPSGTLAGSHNVTTGTDAATAATSSAYAEPWLSPLETLIYASRDGVIVADRTPDGGSALTSRWRSSQLIPNPDRPYLLRFRVRATPSLTRPICKIVSISKSGGTTTTVTTDVPHGLVTGQYVGFYGVYNQANFANQTSGLACTVTGPNTFTVVHGSSASATSYGGFVMRVQGQQALGGAISQVAQSITRVGNVLTVTGSATWASPATIGNIVELIGFRDITNGADLGVDGSYVVRNIATSILTLEPVDGIGPTGADIGATPCGGGVVQRFGVRIHGVTAVDYDPLMTEGAFKGISDGSEGMTVNGSVSASQGSRATLGSGWYVEPDNILVNDITSAAITSTTTSSAVTPTPAGGAAVFSVPVTAVSGTSPTLDIAVEESDDTGTNWYRIYEFPRITATGFYRSPMIPLNGNRLRYVRTIGGTSPSFTMALNRITHQMVSPTKYRQRFDRAVSLTTPNATTVDLWTGGANTVKLVVNVGAITTTAPQLQIEGSDDNGASWYAIGAPLTAVASSTVQLTVQDIVAERVRARVSAAGSGVTPGYVLLRCYGDAT